MRRTTTRSLLGALLLTVTTGAVALTPSPAMASTAITSPVNPNLVLQDEFQGFGTSLAWWSDVVGGWSEPARSQLMDYLFTDSFTRDGQTVQGIDLSIARYNVGASEPGVSYPVVDPHLPTRNGAWIDSLVQADGSYNWNVDANQRWVLAQAAQRGVGTFELFANSAPWWMTYSGHPAGRYSYNSPEGCSHSNLRPEYQDDFAAYLATVADRFATVGVNGSGSPKVNFRTIEPFNEPSNGWWCWGNNQEGTYLTAAEQSSIITNLRSALRTRGMNTDIAATDSNNYAGMVSEYDALSDAARAELGQVNAHGYAGSDAAPIRDRVRARDLRFWQSEWGPAGWGGYDITSELDAGLELATRVTNDLSYVGANGWLYWQAVEDSSRGSGPGYWGLIQAPLDGSAQTYAIQKQFYTLGQYSKFIKPGYQIIDAGNGKSVAAYDPASRKLVLVTYNDTTETLPVNFQLNRFSTSGATAQVWRTSATENLAQLAPVTVNAGTLAASVPANSVVSYVLSNVGYSAAASTAEIVNDSAAAYSGSWQDAGYSGGAVGAYGLWDQDEHSSQSIGATATYTFQGTKATLFGTLAPSSGRVGVSVDGGAETTLNLYNTVRLDGVQVWSSPALTAGRHTVRVRVLGQPGTSGGGVWGNVDRLVVEDSAWTDCAADGQTCAFSGTSEVRYGADGDYVRGVHTGGVACTGTVFGHTTPGAERCWRRDVSSTQLVAMHSQQCAGVSGSGTAAGTDVVQWPCTGGSEQRWTLEKATAGYRLRPSHASTMCLDVAGGATSAGANVLQWTCGSAANQVWNLTYARDGYYRATPSHATGMCLDVAGAATGPGGDIVQYTCNGYPNQLWKLARS
ncbi:RICIN domain-containing protein [Micromonospora sp. NBC_01392]|uniref:RICIN domain-containing protein n=1 Tax=Micromonospora sp. NBC_01392 TaxID=2903588 RepID=UPI00324EAEC6